MKRRGGYCLRRGSQKLSNTITHPGTIAARRWVPLKGEPAVVAGPGERCPQRGDESNPSRDDSYTIVSANNHEGVRLAEVSVKASIRLGSSLSHELGAGWLVRGAK